MPPFMLAYVNHKRIHFVILASTRGFERLKSPLDNLLGEVTLEGNRDM